MTPTTPKLTVVLDAMGVIYRVGDDVGELLVPFIRRRGGITDLARIEERYLQASLGNLSAGEFWAHVGLDDRVEDEYLDALELSEGMVEFLEAMHGRAVRLACLSNDVSEWSAKVRRRFRLDRHIDTWVISGEVGCRKPDQRIYRILLERLGCPASSVLFVDDREKNLVAARACGVHGIRFAPDGSEQKPDGSLVAGRFAEIARLVGRMTRHGET